MIRIICTASIVSADRTSTQLPKKVYGIMRTTGGSTSHAVGVELNHA